MRVRFSAWIPWLPGKTLFTARTDELKRDLDRSVFYAQAWRAVHYIVRDPVRNQAMRAYLTALNHGTAPEAAFRNAFGMDYEAMVKAMRSYITGRAATVSTLSGSSTGRQASEDGINITTLDPAADDLLLPAAQLAFLLVPAGAPTVRKADEAILGAVRTAAAKHPGDPFAVAVHAEAEIKLGDRAAVIALLDTGLAARPTDAQLNYLRGLTLIGPKASPADRRQGRIRLTRANTARPDDYRILAAYVRSFATLDLPESAVAVLMRATELAPQIAEIALQAALVQAKRGDRTLAQDLLRPIANDPHGSAGARAAAQVLAALAAGATAEAAAAARSAPNVAQD